MVHQRYGWTDGRMKGRLTIAIPCFALCASRGKNDIKNHCSFYTKQTRVNNYMLMINHTKPSIFSYISSRNIQSTTIYYCWVLNFYKQSQPRLMNIWSILKSITNYKLIHTNFTNSPNRNPTHSGILL